MPLEEADEITEDAMIIHAEKDEEIICIVHMIGHSLMHTNILLNNF